MTQLERIEQNRQEKNEKMMKYTVIFSALLFVIATIISCFQP
jgi:hypothetical protein